MLFRGGPFLADEGSCMQPYLMLSSITKNVGGERGALQGINSTKSGFKP